MSDIKAFGVTLWETEPAFLRRWAQDDIENHGKDQEQQIPDYAQPEAGVFEQLLVVGAKEDVADGHPRHDPSEVRHKGHLGGGGERDAVMNTGACQSARPHARKIQKQFNRQNNDPPAGARGGDGDENMEEGIRKWIDKQLICWKVKLRS